MPKSRRNNARKKNLQNYKTVKQIEKHIKLMSTQNQTQSQVPQVRQTPTWKSTDLIEMNGLEFEAISNFVTTANSAVQSIMNRNLLNGTVKLTFEKLSEDGTTYVPMTDEEQAPYQEELQRLITARRQQEQQLKDQQDAVQPSAELAPETSKESEPEAVEYSPSV